MVRLARLGLWISAVWCRSTIRSHSYGWGWPSRGSSWYAMACCLACQPSNPAAYIPMTTPCMLLLRDEMRHRQQSMLALEIQWLKIVAYLSVYLSVCLAMTTVCTCWLAALWHGMRACMCRVTWATPSPRRSSTCRSEATASYDSLRISREVHTYSHTVCLIYLLV